MFSATRALSAVSHPRTRAVRTSSTQTQSERAGTPIFDTVVELERGKVNTWSIVRNVDVAVDAVLSGIPYKVEKRTSIPRDSARSEEVKITACFF